MSTCFNINTTEYKALLEAYDHPYIVDAVITAYQKRKRTDAIPTIEEAAENIKESKVLFSLKQKDFKESLIQNLSRRGIASRKVSGGPLLVNNSSKDTWVYDENVLQNNLKRLYGYLSANHIPFEAITTGRTTSGRSFRVDINENLFLFQDILQSSRGWDTTRANHVFKHLQKLFPQVKYQYVTPTEAKAYYDSLDDSIKANLPKDFNGVNSFYENGMVTLIKGRLTNDTPIEEMLHPFVDSVALDNPELFAGLLKEAQINFPKLAQQINDSYTDARGFSDTHRNLELVTQSLTRHFRNEFENEPTKSFKERISDFIKWFGNIINDLHKYLTGKAIPELTMSKLNSTMSLSDVAKLLNTSDIQFTLSKGVDARVRFSLSEERQKVLAKIKSNTLSDAQKQLIDRLFFASGESKDQQEQFAAGLADGQIDVVVYDQDSKNFVNISESTLYKDANDIINSNSKVLKTEADVEIKSIITAIAEGKAFENIKGSLSFISEENAESIYEDLSNYISDLKSWGDVIIPQVTIFDKDTNVADIADLLILGLDGKLKIINISTSSYDFVNENQKEYKNNKWDLSEDSMLKEKANIDTLSKQAQDALRANIQRRILENMGYEVLEQPNAISSYHIQYNAETKQAEIKGSLDYTNRKNDPYVDMLVPQTQSLKNKFEVDEIISKDELSEEDFVRPEELGYEFTAEDLDNNYYDKIVEALKTYKSNLEKRLSDIRTIKGAITLNKSKEAAAEKIDAEIGLILSTLAMQDDRAISALVTDILMSSIKDVRELKEYLDDDANASSPEYIGIINNASDFLRLWSGFIDTLPISDENKTSELSVNQIKLKDRLQSLIIELAGQNATENKGILRKARFNYVKETIYNTTSQDLTKDEIEILLSEAKDITITSYLARDLATSTDLPSRVLDKLYKRQKVKLMDSVQSISDTNMRLASRVSKLTGGNTAKDIWSWMYELDKDDIPTGFYVQEIGQQYFTQLQELWDSVRDEKGHNLEYVEITDLASANPEDIRYNKELYLKKQARTQFLSAESIDNGNFADGDYHAYTQEFKTERAKVQEWVKLSKNYGEWQFKTGVTIAEQRSFQNKYFDFKTINKAIKENNIFTGKVIKIDNVPFVKNKYKEVRKESSVRTGSKDMLSKKYTDIINDSTELGIARKAYYDFWKQTYEQDLLNRIPVAERDKMLGRLPLVQDNMTDTLFSKGGGMAGVATKFKDGVKKAFNTTSRLTRIPVDANGNIVDTLPIMYTGSPQNPENIEKLKQKINDVDLQLIKNVNDKKLVQELEKELAILQKSLSIERSKPLKESISFDLPATMEAFASMAINYDVMSSLEDTIVAFIGVMDEDTQYKPKDTVFTKAKSIAGVKASVQERAKAVDRVLWWKNNIFYGQYKNSTTTFEKGISNLMRYSSLTYVAFNPTGNLNNWIMGRVNNGIEQLGGRFYSSGDYRKAEAEFYSTMMPVAIQRFAKKTADLSPFSEKYKYDPNKPMNLYEALVDEFLMTDPKADLREFVEGSASKSFKTRLIEFGYSAQDAGEYQLQTTVGHAILRGTYVRNSTTNEISSLRDLYYYDAENHKAVKKEGFDEVILYNKKSGEFKVTGAYDENFRYDVRNKIREVNKQIHGSYSSEDLMVIEGFVLGRMATQFKKWVMPAIRNRVQDNYYDENLGWIEGRYNSLWKFLGTVKRYTFQGQKSEASLIKQFLKESGYDESLGEFNQLNIGALNKLKNVYRNTADLGLILMVLLIGDLFDLMEDDDDDNMLIRRAKNLAKYQASRLTREQLMFVPVSPQGAKQLYETADSPFAVLRVGYEAYEAIAATTTYGYYKGIYATTQNDEDWFNNKEVFYQRGAMKGQSKVSKQWKDVVPILYSFKKIQSFDQPQEFWIK